MPTLVRSPVDMIIRHQIPEIETLVHLWCGFVGKGQDVRLDRGNSRRDHHVFPSFGIGLLPEKPHQIEIGVGFVLFIVLFLAVDDVECAIVDGVFPIEVDSVTVVRVSLL